MEIIKSVRFKNKNLIFFIENPVGKLRKLDLLNPQIRTEVTYCQYGDSRQKPTDLWTNMHWWKPKPRCRRRAKCHKASWRGSDNGTQGMRNDYERSKVPHELCKSILEAI